MYDWDGYESDSDDTENDTSSTTSTTLKDIRLAVIQPLGESINKDIDDSTARIEAKFDSLTAKIDEMMKYLADSHAKIFTGKDTPADAQEENNLTDTLSKIVTSKKVDDLTLTGDGGESGEYNDSLNGRIQKTTEMVSGMLVGIFTEDEIKAKLEATDINKLDSIEENLGDMVSHASFMKNGLRRDSNFTLDNGNEHNPSNPLGEIERAIKALVLGYIHGDLKGDVSMAVLKGEPFPKNVPEAFWNDLKAAYAKSAGDFTRTINEFDGNDADDHEYPNLNITDK